MKYKADPITMQVIRYAMEQIADEMGHTLVRTARSTIIKEIKDGKAGTVSAAKAVHKAEGCPHKAAKTDGKCVHDKTKTCPHAKAQQQEEAKDCPQHKDLQK